MELSFRGSVNRWECDENEHLNVRFYMEKLWQTLACGLVDLGHIRAAQAEGLLDKIQMQHIRFLRESRIAAPLSGYIAVVGDGLVLTELRNASTDEVSCACLHRFVGLQIEPTEVIPPYAAPRGITDGDLPHARLDLPQARRHGFRTIGRGIIQAGECATTGRLHMQHYMGRFSDAMPHLWGAYYEADPDEGGAVVEYRLRYHEPLHLNDRYELVSGVYEVGEKTQRFAHLLFNLATGRASVSAESVGVRIDLTRRRAKVLTTDVRERMRSEMIDTPNRTG